MPTSSPPQRSFSRFLQISFSWLILGLVLSLSIFSASADTPPTPAGHFAGGLFGHYFENMVFGADGTGKCPNGQGIIGFKTMFDSSFGSVICDSVASYWLKGTSNNIYYTGGYVGIGTTTPLTDLDIYDASMSGSILWIRTPLAAVYAGAQGALGWIGTSNLANFILTTNSQPRMIISSTGNVALVGSGQLTLPNLPIQGTDATNKNYVDAQVVAAGGGWVAGSYWDTGGKPYYCHNRIISTTGFVVDQSYNAGMGCDLGKACSQGSCIPNGPLTVGSFNGYTYQMTPSGCTDSTTPTCLGTPDTVMKTWGAWPFNTGLSSLLNGSYNSAYLATNYTNTYAAKYCENMVYGGYTDWYLPALSELNFLYTSQPGGGFTTANAYWSSTEGISAYYADIENLVNGGQASTADKTISYYIRCIRKF